MACNNAGANVCFLCHGRGQEQCGLCAGTGKKLRLVKTNTGSGNLVSNKPVEKEKWIDPFQQQQQLNSSLIAGFSLAQKPGTLKKGVDSIYYIGFKRPYTSEPTSKLTLQLFAVYRYSDGSYPLWSDILDKSKHATQVNQAGSTRLLGYFESMPAAKNAMRTIAERGAEKNIAVQRDERPQKINPPVKGQPKTEDFWNNK